MRDRRIGRTWDDATRCGQKTRAKGTFISATVHAGLE